MNQNNSSPSARVSASLVCAALACISLAAPQESSGQSAERPETAIPPEVIHTDWCGTRVIPQPIEDGIAGGPAADCGGLTNPPGLATNPFPPGDPYAPTLVKYRIPVVFHVVHNGAGENPGGMLTVARVQSQITQLNNDFLSVTGTPGDPGIDVQIEFYLNTAVDGDGIMYHNNAAWFAGDTGFSSTTVDAHNNLNIFSFNMPDGVGGMGNLPQGCGTPDCVPVGEPMDIIRLDYFAVGNPSLAPSPYHQGRVLTHEAGHYLGLYHTFQFACAEPDTWPQCNMWGDAICDTATHQTYDTCGVSNTCPTGGNDPVDNYMNYTSPTCHTTFTAEQARRARCTLMNWRPQLGEPVYGCLAPPVFVGNFSSTPHTLLSHVAKPGTTIFTPGSVCPPGLTDGSGVPPNTYAGSIWWHDGNEIAYKILHGGGDLQVDLTGLSGDLDLMLLGTAGTPANTLARSENGGFVNESVFLAAAAPGVYYAVVDTYEGESAFSLTYRGVPVGYNLDINAGVGGYDQPASTFGAAAAQPGTWTLLTGQSDLSEDLAVANGFVTSASITRSNAIGGGWVVDHPNTTGDFQMLLDDFQSAPPNTTYTFANLVPGNYRVYTYAIAPDGAVHETVVSVSGSPDPSALVGGPMPVNGFVLNDTHAEHRVTLAPGETIQVTINQVPGNFITVNGFQIKPQSTCAADLNGDDFVNVADLLAVIAAWGQTGNPPADINGDDIVNVVDLLAVIGAWGVCPG